MDIDTFYKTEAYGCLYKASGESVDERSADDITISIIRDTRPDGLFRYFKEHDVRVANPFVGIYYILDAVLFRTQIIVGRELEQKNHTWIKALSDRIPKQEMRKLLERIHGLTQKFDRELADSVLEVSIRANMEIVEELRGDDSMCQALLEIMEPEINEIRKKEEEKGRIYGAISVYQDMGLPEDEIIGKLQEKYHLSKKEAENYLLAETV